VEMLLPGRVNL